ncbi:DUF5719 family protein [Georgenia muralis]|uniref:Uncharacterized protein n=1 Tax=Georgenia muralis TaxID=154117 RepID=A0A3N5A1Y6_9MICO|nr:DUF5719 family protein [Georgenia muralis]RPF25891.1 hypothetical protein EDD32_0305 [Georgenia muralis]
MADDERDEERQQPEQPAQPEQPEQPEQPATSRDDAEVTTGPEPPEPSAATGESAQQTVAAQADAAHTDAAHTDAEQVDAQQTDAEPAGGAPAPAEADSSQGGASAATPSRKVSALRVVGLTASALALVGAAAGIVVLGDRADGAPTAALDVPVVAVPPGTITQVCAGPPELTTGEGMSVDPDVDPSDVVPETVLDVLSLPRDDSAAGEASFSPLDGDEVGLERAGAVRRLEVTDPPGPGVLRARPAGTTSALVAGATLTRTDAGDLRGLVATPCLAPATTSWLVGGATELGQSSALVLTNSGQTPATVDATLWTSLGLADAPRLRGVTVAPGERTTILLEGVASADPALALRVEAAGGEVTASIQDLRLDGLVAAGIDTVTPGAAPALRTVVPGVVLDGAAPGAVATSAVRLVNPGDETATASVLLLGEDGAVQVPGADAVVLDPGAVLDLSLDGIEGGVYAVEIDSDVPVTGAVVLARTGTAGDLDPDTAPVDRAWTAASELLTSAVLPLPGLGSLAGPATVTLTNPGEDDVDVELTPVGGDAGDVVEVTVPARSTTATDIAEGVAVVMSADAGVAAAVVLTAESADGELITVLPASPDPHTARSVRVDVR